MNKYYTEESELFPPFEPTDEQFISGTADEIPTDDGRPAVPEPDEQEWYTIKDAAIVLNLTPRSIVTRITTGRLKADRLGEGKAFRIHRDDLYSAKTRTRNTKTVMRAVKITPMLDEITRNANVNASAVYEAGAWIMLYLLKIKTARALPNRVKRAIRDALIDKELSTWLWGQIRDR
jgi:excisionase family DNA binding protein